MHCVHSPVLTGIMRLVTQTADVYPSGLSDRSPHFDICFEVNVNVVIGHGVHGANVIYFSPIYRTKVTGQNGTVSKNTHLFGASSHVPVLQHY